MALANYSDLQTAIANWLARDGDTSIISRVPDFIAMAEARIAYGSLDQQMPSDALRIRAMETLNTTLASVAGTSTVALPTGFLAMRRLQVVASPNDGLEYLTPAQMDAEYNDSTRTGQPKAYTIEGENFRFGPIPDAIYTFNCLYYQKFTALSSNSTNWLLTNNPGIYLYGSLIEAAPFIGNDERLQVWYRMYVGLINALNASDSSDRHAGSLLSMRSDIGTP